MKKESKIESPAVQLGRLGGAAVVKKHGKKHMSKIGKLGAKKRWENKK